MRRGWSWSVVVVFLAVFVAGAAQAGTSAPAALVLGPIPLPPEAGSGGPLAPELEPVPELDPVLVRPAEGEAMLTGGQDGSLRWHRVELEDGVFRASAPGIFWEAVRFDLDRWARVTVGAPKFDSYGCK